MVLEVVKESHLALKSHSAKLHSRRDRSRYAPVKNKCTQLAKYIHWRHADFNNGNIISCYVVKNDSAVLITAAEIEKGEEAIIYEL